VLWRHNRELCTGKQCLRCVAAYRRPPQYWRYTGLLERESRHVDTFIAMSEFSRAKHAEFGFPFEMEVLPYFLPDDEGAHDAALDTSPHGRPYFLFVGRLEAIKGLDDVIPAFRDFEGADLLIAGDGTHGDTLRALAEGNERVKFLGRLTPDELARYYRHARALIVPSVCYETFGIILIESFSHGTPVIARRIGPFPEIVDAAGGGALFGTRAELIAAMQRMLHDDAYRDDLARSGWEARRRLWSESAVIPRYLDIVRRAAERKGATGVIRKLTERVPA
jgi:glycosyltransferase involved in cell wall biosynthesis